MIPERPASPWTTSLQSLADGITELDPGLIPMSSWRSLLQRPQDNSLVTSLPCLSAWHCEAKSTVRLGGPPTRPTVGTISRILPADL